MAISVVPTLITFGLIAVSVQCLPFYPSSIDSQQPGQFNAELFNAFQEQAPVVDVDLEQQDVQEQPEPESTPSNEYNVQVNIGQPSGVAVNNQSQLVVLHRGGRVWDESSFDEKSNVFNSNLGAIKNSTIAVLDPSTGDLISEHGRGLFYMPHGLSVDPEGNYWVTDVGLHQVFKLDRNFKPLLVLGEKLTPGSDEKHFCKPTDVAVSKTGEVFIADGYCNSRIMKFSADGKFISSFGGMNSDETQRRWKVPHSLTLIEDLNLLCVADRENQRVECFTAGLSPKGAHQRFVQPTGTFVTKAENIGRIFAIRETRHYLVGITNTEPEKNNEFEIFIMDINTGRANTFAKGIPDAHALALNNNGDIFVAQLNPSQILKYSAPQEPENGDAVSGGTMQ